MGRVETNFKQTEIGLIPVDWEDLTFKDICWVNQGLQIPISQRLTLPNKNSKIYITIQYLNDGKAIEYIDDYVTSVYCGKEDVLMTRTGNTGIVVSGVEGVFHNNFFKINFDRKKVDKDFLIYYLNQSRTKKIILAQAGTSTIPDLNHRDFYSIPIPLPQTKAEQTAIANALSDADGYIESLEKLIAKKQLIKQGAMQQLLSPKPHWKPERFGDVVRVTKGQLITSETRVEGNIPVIAGGKSPAYYHNKPNRLGKTITISASGASAGYVSFHDYPIFASDCSTIEEDQNYSIEFIFFLLQLMQEKIYKMQTGGAQPHIHASDLNPIEIIIPSKKSEQLRIAKILSDMDTEINIIAKNLTKAKNLKQGMMQQLLTGKIRLV